MHKSLIILKIAIDQLRFVSLTAAQRANCTYRRRISPQKNSHIL